MSCLTIRAVETTLLDLPIRRPHHFATVTIDRQSVLLVRLRTAEGIDGLGEAVTPGGPWWGGESVEGIKATIDGYLAPLLVGEDACRITALLGAMDRVVAGNPFAKAAVEMALFDAKGKALGVPVYELLGGLVHASIPVTWALAAGDQQRDIAEAEEKLVHGEHAAFKLKMGELEPAADVRRVGAIARALAPRASVRVDLNSAWSEATAMRWLPALEEAGVELVEQPIPRWNLDGMARLAAAHRVAIMADESLGSVQDAWEIARRAAADVFALKLHKSGGIQNVTKIAAIAEATGIPCYGGASLETSIGTAAAAHVFATLPQLTEGCELFGPLWLADDLVEEPVAYRDGRLCVPQGPGLGVQLDEQQVRRYTREREAAPTR